MEHYLLFYGVVFAFALAALFLALRSDGSLSDKLAKVRVRIEENRHKGISQPQEEEFEPFRTLEILLLGAILLLICMLLSKV